MFFTHTHPTRLQGRFGKRPEVHRDGGRPGADGLGQLHGVAYRVRGSFLPSRAAGELNSFARRDDRVLSLQTCEKALG